MNPLLAVSDARTRLLANVEPLPPEQLSLSRAARRVLSEDVAAPLDLPVFDNSSMDGFAVRAADLAGATPDAPVILPVVADIPAGTPPPICLAAGQAARIMTGAMLPAGADAVIPLEDTGAGAAHSATQPPATVAIYRRLAAGDYVRRQGEDLRRGDIVLEAGRRLRPQDLGLLAMCGVDPVSVYRRPKVAILSTGDELVRPPEPLAAGKIYESNSIVLAALVQAQGGIALDLGIAGDDPAAIKASLDQALALDADLILSSAGVSVGAYDFLRAVVEEHGHLDFWRVNMRPGKPLLVGAYRQTRLIGLPGNPVSAYVGFLIFVRPLLERLAGAHGEQELWQAVYLAEAVRSDGRESYLRARVTRHEGAWYAHLTGHQGSGNLRSLVQANALLKIPAGVYQMQAGDRAEAWFLAGDA